MLTKMLNGDILSFLGHHYQPPRTHSQPCYQSKMVTEVLTTEKTHSRGLRMMDKKASSAAIFKIGVNLLCHAANFQ